MLFRSISTEDINNLLGRLSFDVLSSLAAKIISSEPQTALEDLENIYNSGNEPVQILTNLMDYLKNILVVKNCRSEIALELTQANDAQIKILKEQAEKLETHQIVFLIEKAADYIKELKLTNNPRLWLEVSIIDLANLAENSSLIDLQNRIARLEGGNVQPVAQYKAPSLPKPDVRPSVKQQEAVVKEKEVIKVSEDKIKEEPKQVRSEEHTSELQSHA